MYAEYRAAREAATTAHECMCGLPIDPRSSCRCDERIAEEIEQDLDRIGRMMCTRCIGWGTIDGEGCPECQGEGDVERCHAETLSRESW